LYIKYNDGGGGNLMPVQGVLGLGQGLRMEVVVSEDTTYEPGSTMVGVPFRPTKSVSHLFYFETSRYNILI
jgi:hypothetical protein